jgi:hypothetical protein
MLYSGRRPGIKDGIGFQQGDNVKLNASKRLSNFVKGKAPMAQDNEGYCWRLVLKCYELRTRQHKMLNINVLRPSKHYFP